MGSTSTKTYQADFRFELLNGNLTWSASGGNWPWDVPFQPYLDGGVFRIWKPQEGSVSYKLDSYPYILGRYPAIANEGLFDRLGFAQLLSASITNIGDVIHQGTLEPSGARVLIVPYTAIQSIPTLSPKALDFNYNFIEGTDTSNFEVRIDDDGTLSYNNKEINIEQRLSTSPGNDSLDNVAVGQFPNLNNDNGMFRLAIKIINTDGRLVVTFDKQYAPPVVSVSIAESVIFILLDQDISSHKLGATTNITTSSVTVPQSLKFNVDYTPNAIMLMPVIIGGSLLTMIKPGEELGLSILFIAFN